MTQRPWIRWRIGLIIVIGFLSVLLVPVALFYSAQGIDRVTALPQPQQLSAIVALVEGTPPSDRQAIFEAMRSAQLSLRVALQADVATDLEPFWPVDDERTERYRRALGNRPFAAYAVPRALFRPAFVSPLEAAEFRVGLRDGGVLIVAVEGMRMFNTRGVPVGFPVAFLGIIVAFIALVLLNREFRPVLRLAKAVEALDPSDPNARLPRLRAGTEEVRALIQAFDRQQERVATLLRARAVLVGGIQHDVRTFATRLRLRVEKLSDGAGRRQAEDDIADLIALMDSALLATRSEAGQLDLELIDAIDLLSTEVHDRQNADYAIDLAVDPSATGAQVLADRLALRRIVSNLIENAVRYGKAAHVSARTD
jgi:signal transduction histidine kinase